MADSLKLEMAKDSLKVGTHVKATVRCHRPFGIFVDIPGIPFVGLVQITDFKDVARMTIDEYPPPGVEIEACVLGFKDLGQQIWLGMRPSQMNCVRW